MTHVLSFRPEVEEDAIGGYGWYQEKATGLGDEFLRVFYTCAQEIPRNPFLYRKIYKDFRRTLLRRFPYAIYFRIEDDKVVVFGLFHCARNPVIIQNILRDRQQGGP